MATEGSGKRVVRPRNKRRVEVSGKSAGANTKSAAHREAALPDPVPEGKIEIVGQASELVPVAQFANVTVGPIAARRLIDDPGLSKLVGTDPDDWSAEQKRIADRFKDEIKVMNLLIQEVIADDRETIEESVRLHNQREAEEAKKEARGKK